MASVLIILALPFILIFLLPKLKRNGETHRPPGPPRLPLIGNLHQFDASTPHVYLWKLSKKYGPLMSLRLGFVQAIVVSSPRLAEEVMKTHDLTFCSRPVLRGGQKLSYNGLDVALTPYSEYWREMRKICVFHLFSSKRVQSFHPIRKDEVARMIKVISELASSSKATNLSETIMSLTSSIICRIAFGKRYDDGGHERRKFDALLHEAQAMFVGFFASDYFPLMGWVDKLTGMRARLEKNFKELDLFYQKLIDEHLNPNGEKSMDEDILDILLDLRKDQSSSLDLSMDHIKAMLMNLFIAGTDTAAATIVWAMTALIKNPKVMTKVQEEIRSLIGKKGIVEEDDIQELTYLKAIIKETFRLYPPAPLLAPRETMQSCILDGYEVKPKTLVYVNVWAIARDPEYWKNPEEFFPDRFLGSPIDFRGQDFEFLPFGAGRRGCPGMSLGLATVELALANILYSFDWELPAGIQKEDIDTDVLPGLVVHKKNALCLMAKNYM